MKFTLNNFYSNNYKDFIHLEALKNVLRKVPRLKLAGVENIDNVLSMEFSVDDWGENPMYIKYIDTDNKEHIVKIRPAVTEQIYEILKAYAKISYVDEQDKKLKDELHTEIMQGDENTLDLSKTYTDTVVNHAKDEINHTIETTKQELKDYCDNKCAITLASSKDYTDTKAHELNQRIDEESNRITAVSQLVTANDNKTIQALTNVNDRIDNLPRSSEVTLGGTTFKERLNIETDNPNDFYSTVTLEQRDGSEPEVVGRLVKGDVAKKADLDLLSGKVTDLSTTKDNRLSEIPKTGKATYVNWYPNGNINYIRLLDDGEYTRAHINKPDGLEQVVYLPKSKIGDKPTGTPTDIKFNTGEDVTGINFLPGNPDRVVVSTAKGLRMNASFITQTEKTNIANLVSWKTNVTDELTRMNGSVVDIPKEQFTPLNGLTIDRNTAFGKIFKFNNFAIIRLNVFVANITMPSWTFKDAVSFPKSYLSGFSKFTALNEKRQITDDNWPYDNSFDIDKCMLGFYTRGNEYNNKGLELSIAGMLYN